MKKALLLLSIFSLVACTSSKEEKIFSDFDKKYAEEEKSCLKLEELMQESTINNPDDVRFVKDEDAALKVIENFDIKPLSYSRYHSHYILLNQHCFHDKKGMFYACPNPVTSYLFFRALIKTSIDTPWSKPTQDKALKLVSQHIRQQVFENEGGLLDKGSSLELLELMAQKGVLNKDLLPEIQKLIKQVESDRESIKSGKLLNCEEALKKDQKEMQLTEIISAKMSHLLSSLPN